MEKYELLSLQPKNEDFVNANKEGFSSKALLTVDIGVYGAIQEKILNLSSGDHVVIKATDEGLLIMQKERNFPDI